LSDGDIRKLLGDDIRILTYPELKHMRSIDECFDSKGRCILLFLTTSPTEGHWCCMLRKKKGIEFFDPYGDPPEAQKKGISGGRLAELDVRQPYLTQLMRGSGKPVYYNTYDFQRDKSSVNTCGRHCVVRCLYSPYSLEKYEKIIKKSGMTPDEFVSGVTANYLGK
jgi:hypothetical protein